MEFGSFKFLLWIATQGFRIIKDFSNLGARERGVVQKHSFCGCRVSGRCNSFYTTKSV